MNDRIFPVVSLLIVWLGSLLIGAVGPAESADPVMRFLLSDGSSIEGRLLASEVSDQVRVECPLLRQPLEFPTENLLEARLVGIGGAADASSATGVSQDDGRAGLPMLAFGLHDHNQFVGHVVSESDGVITLETEDLGRVEFRVDQVARVIRQHRMPRQILSLSNSRYRFRHEDGWRFGDSGLSGQTPEAATVADFELPDRFHIRLSVRCAGEADFELSLGDRSSRGAGQGGGRIDRRGGSLSRLPTERYVTRLEWLGRSVSLVRSNASVSDAEVFDLAETVGRLELELYIDQTAGRMVAFRDGLLQGDVALVDDEPVTRQSLTLINRRDPVEVMRLDLFDWDGRVPESRSLPDRYTLLRDGTLIAAVAEQWERDRFRVDGVWQQIEDLAQMEIATAGQISDDCELVMSGGCRLWGRLDGAGPKATMQIRDAAGITYQVSPPRVVRLSGRSNQTKTAPDDASELFAEGVHLWGSLLDGRKLGAAFAWRPSAGTNSSAIVAEQGVQIRFASAEDRADELQGRSGTTDAVLELRSGDRLPGELIEIKGDAVRFRSELCGEVSVAPAEVSRIQWGSEVAIDESALGLLLSLPRRMQSTPPTHLIVSRQGDVLRGRLLSIESDVARIEVRGIIRVVDRPNIAAVIWLNQDAGNDKSCGYVAATGGGARLGLENAQFDGIQLQAKHRILGTCRVPADALEQLRIGTREVVPRETWQLVPVKEPKTFE